MHTRATHLYSSLWASNSSMHGIEITAVGTVTAAAALMHRDTSEPEAMKTRPGASSPERHTV